MLAESNSLHVLAGKLEVWLVHQGSCDVTAVTLRHCSTSGAQSGAVVHAHGDPPPPPTFNPITCLKCHVENALIALCYFSAFSFSHVRLPLVVYFFCGFALCLPRFDLE